MKLYNMKYVAVFFLFLLGPLINVSAQCIPDPTFTMSPLPGVYPPNIPISGIPVFGIADGQENVPYNQDLTLVVLEDTTLDIGFLLPSSVVSAMSSAGIPTLMTVDVNYVSFDITGLPDYLTDICNINNCQYPSGTNGCIAIVGTPEENGTFPIDINMVVNIQIPAITIPVVGTVYVGGGQDLPSFSAQQYDLFIDASSQITNYNQNNKIFPNPACLYSILEINELSKIEIYNILGERVQEYVNVKESVILEKSKLGVGLFYINIITDRKKETKKLIIK